MKDEKPSAARRQYEEASASDQLAMKEEWRDSVQRNYTLLGFYEWLENRRREFEVKVTRVSYQRVKVRVSAISVATAEDEAQKMAGDIDFSGSSVTDRYEADVLGVCDQ